MEQLISPLEMLFAPIFFVLMGMQVNLVSFLRLDVLALALVLTFVAIVGKLASGLPARKGLRLSVGLGMIPRGEVGLVFATIGRGLGVVSDGVFAALVIVVIVTTLITPVTLRWALLQSGLGDSRGRRPATSNR